LKIFWKFLGKIFPKNGVPFGYGFGVKKLLSEFSVINCTPISFGAITTST
jgi:hypothetical protein